MGSTVEASKDPNTVIVRAFSKETVKKSELVYNGATKILSNFKRQINTIQSNSDADEILKFKQLLDQGIITEEEFLLKKKTLLGL